MPDEALRAMIIRDEGKRLKPYRDTLGILTIGVGRNLEDVGITAEEADAMLEHDIEERRQSLSRFDWFLRCDDVRQGVLINMAFMGIPRLLGFYKMIAWIEVQDWDRAADEMLDSYWAHQVGARAQRLALQMREGRWI